jgi:outer membrane receptor protein involved in Fe transport
VYWEPRKAAAALIAASTFAACICRADGLDASWPGAAERTSSATATLHIPSGWTASLLLTTLDPRSSPDRALFDESAASLRSSTFVNGRLSRKLTPNARISFDVFNVFDQRVRNVDPFSSARLWEQSGASDSFLSNPSDPRGFRLKLRITF